MAYPSAAPFHWATGSPAYRSPNPIPTARQDTGVVNGDTADALWFNSLLGNVTDWTCYLGELFPSDQVFQIGTLNVANGSTVLGTFDYTGTVFRITAPAAATELRIAANGSDPITLTAGNVALGTTGNLTLAGFAAAVGVFAEPDANGRRFGFVTTQPTIIRDYSPCARAWLWWSYDGGVVSTVTPFVRDGANSDTIRVNLDGAGSKVLGRTEIGPTAYDAAEVSAVETITSLEVIFADDTATQPTVSLIRQTRDGNATEVVMASCQPTAVASRQTITDSTITSGSMAWGTYRYFLQFEQTGMTSGDNTRGVESVRVTSVPFTVRS